MLEKLSNESKLVLTKAKEAAIGLNNNYIGTEHILLGLLKEGEMISRILENLGASLAKIHAVVEFITEREQKAPIPPDEIDFTPRAKRVIKLALDESQRRESSWIEPEDILYGLLIEKEGVAAGVLEGLGITLAKVYAERNKELDEAIINTQATLRFLEKMKAAQERKS